MAPIISIQKLTKTYASGTHALDSVSLDIRQGEIIALLGPNGAGKTTLIGAICGMVKITSGTVTVGGFDVEHEPRKARAQIGLVPQEIALDIFETVWNSVKMTRGLFGQKPDDTYLEELLKSLSLWDKKDAKNQALSGGMKRRVMIAKALSHEPKILFLDEPTAGVDVALRRDMWEVVRKPYRGDQRRENPAGGRHDHVDAKLWPQNTGIIFGRPAAGQTRRSVRLRFGIIRR
jgi:ABC-2 type transport system ATP-binding protein